MIKQLLKNIQPLIENKINNENIYNVFSAFSDSFALSENEIKNVFLITECNEKIFYSIHGTLKSNNNNNVILSPSKKNGLLSDAIKDIINQYIK